MSDDPLDWYDQEQARRATAVAELDQDDGAPAGEYRVFGPPGTGKTSFLKAQVEKWADVFEPSRLVVSTFTRTAAAEIGGRLRDEHGRPVLDRRQVGTLHSLAYHALDAPDVAEPHAAEFNDAHPAYRISTEYRPDLDDGGQVEQAGSTEGDKLQAQAEQLRARLVPEHLWPSSVLGWWQAWSEWKRETNRLDFTDLIETALTEVATAPGDPLVGMFDEVQDFTPLELRVVRKWGGRMRLVLLAGDDDQCIYGFKGATPDAFLDPPVDDDHKRVLRQSYRVPTAVHAVAQAWVEQLTRREPKVYEPRAGDPGAVRFLDRATIRAPEAAIDDALAQLEEGRTVMFLTTCAYQLDTIKALLRRNAVPFHNPYRRKRGDWNPLVRGTARRRMPVDRLLAYLRPSSDVWGDKAREWTGADVRDWIKPLRTRGLFRHKIRETLEHLPAVEVDPDLIEAALVDEQQGRMGEWLAWSLDWYEEMLLPSRAKPFAYPLQVARQRGGAALVEPPRCVIGTIHSVKGGEADVVYLFPDLSMPGMREWEGTEKDGTVRQFYVGMTRARQELVVCQAASPLAVRPEHLLMGAAA